MGKLWRSLRIRLQIWHALILFCVVTGFGSVLFQRVMAARWDEIDANLLAAGRVIEGALREVPLPILDSLAQDLGEHRGLQEDRPLPGSPPRGVTPGTSPPERRRRPPSAVVGPGGAPLNWESPELDSSGGADTIASAWEETLKLPSALPARLGRDGPAYYVVWRVDGSILKQSALPYDTPARPRLADLARMPRHSFAPRVGPLREVFLLGPQNTLICVGRPVHSEIEYSWNFAGQLTLAGGAILLAGLCGGWWLSRSAIVPLENMTQLASQIGEHNLSERIDLGEFDIELARLGSVLNGMLERIEHAFESQKQFTADASHELRTPLAILLTTIELSLSKVRQPEEYQHQLQKCQRAALRMKSLVEALLQLARNETSSESHQEQVDLSEVAGEAIEVLKPLAASHEVTIECQLQPVTVTGNAMELGQVITNLVSNAIVYNRASGSVHVDLRADSANIQLSVRDTGLGIPQQDVPYIFDRFFRASIQIEPTQRVGLQNGQHGHGLGLAICKRIVEAHHGTITVSSQLEVGSQFVVTLPASANSAFKTQKTEII